MRLRKVVSTRYATTRSVNPGPSRARGSTARVQRHRSRQKHEVELVQWIELPPDAISLLIDGGFLLEDETDQDGLRAAILARIFDRPRYLRGRKI